MDKFYMKLAGLTVEADCRFALARELCRDYIVDTPENVDITASVAPELARKNMNTQDGAVTEEEAEAYALYRVIAEKLPSFGAFVFHGAAVSYGGRGYIFTAPSGTGKTTHICLWKKFLQGTDIINGDKPIIKTENGKTYVYSAPWAGKEGWQKNVTFPLGGICVVNRGTENVCERQNPQSILPELMHQLYLPKNAQSVGKTLELVDALMKNVPVYRHKCDISEDAVKASFRALTGMDYIKETKKI